MVVKTCPTCKGVGHVEMAPSTHKGGNFEGGQLVQVDVRKVLDLLKSGKSCYEVSKSVGCSAETVRTIGNGTWAGYKRKFIERARS